jgi:drug/metabolite transporter superfamily protein YnfA
MKWFYLPPEKIKRGIDDWGGIWVCKSLSKAQTLKKYMNDKYETNVKIFTCLIDKILFENSYRTKTNGIKLLREINETR